MVYGCECWWGDEEAVTDRLDKFKKLGFIIVDTDIDKVREDFNKKELEEEPDACL